MLRTPYMRSSHIRHILSAVRPMLAIALIALLAACSAAPQVAPSASPPASVAASASSAAEASPSATASASPAADSAASDALLAYELTDVSSGETFTLGELAADRPVLVETMAIWCTTCRAQQREVVVAHRSADFHSVGIDVDPNERAQDLAEYAEREGFDWRFAVADPQLVHLLTERYGFGVTNPPSTPTFVVSPGGAVRALEFGRVRSADELVTELAAR
jgi:thiol-disulfide isomerase/thioredoxin